MMAQGIATRHTQDQISSSGDELTVLLNVEGLTLSFLTAGGGLEVSGGLSCMKRKRPKSKAKDET